MSETFLNEKVILHCGDCLEVLPMLAENSVDSCVTDPPYHLISIVERFGSENAAPVRSNMNRDPETLQDWGRTSPYQRASAGFMGKQWDGGDIAFRSDVWREVYRVLKPGAHLLAFGGTRTYHRLACAIEDAGFDMRDTIMWVYGTGFPKSHNIGDGWGTALKPACEPIVLARKPLSEKTVAVNVLRWGTGAINVDGCRIETNPNIDDPRLGGNGGSLGRWPANLIHDGSEEVVAGFPLTNPTKPTDGRDGGKLDTRDQGWGFRRVASKLQDNGGSAARFFYTAKADGDDRLGSKHPTVKPIDLIRYLIRLITPIGGVCVDPFAGTGTTGEAAFYEGMRAVLIEREAEYQDDIRRRMVLAMAGPEERVRESIKARTKDKPLDAGPLFSNK